MLHIVQAVFAGMAEMPRVFLDRADAESAFVEYVKKCWKQSYPAYCESNGVGADSFASTQAFLDTLDLSEKSRINYWVVNAEDAGPEKMKLENLVGRLEQRTAALRDELTGFLDEMEQLREKPDSGDLPAEARPAEPETRSVLPPSMPRQDEPKKSAERYASREWKSFVQSIVNMCGGSRSEFSPLARSDWRQAVYSNLTSLEYWDWVAEEIETSREKAEKSGYALVEDPDSPGHVKIRTPDGSVGEASFYSEWEAWCYARTHLEDSAAAV